MFGEIIYDVVSAGSGGYALMRTRFGKTEFCGVDGYWTRSPDYVNPFPSQGEAGAALGKLQESEGSKPNDKQVRHGRRNDGAAKNAARHFAKTVVKPAGGGAGGGVQG